MSRHHASGVCSNSLARKSNNSLAKAAVGRRVCRCCWPVLPPPETGKSCVVTGITTLRIVSHCYCTSMNIGRLGRPATALPFLKTQQNKVWLLLLRDEANGGPRTTSSLLGFSPTTARRSQQVRATYYNNYNLILYYYESACPTFVASP